MNNIGLALFTSLVCFSAMGSTQSKLEIDFYKTDSRPFTHTLPLNFVLFEKGPWKLSELKSNLEETARIYAQCGVKIEVDSLQYDEGKGEVYFDLEGYTDPDEIKDPTGGLTLAKKYAKTQIPTIFLMESFDPDYASILATAVPEERIQSPDQRVALNTIWVNHYNETMRTTPMSEGGYPPGYNVIAHEIGHVVMNTQHIQEHYVRNLMHETFPNLNGHLTKAQCHNVKSSPLVKKIPVASHIVCPEITSPLRGSLIFLNGINKDCQTASSIIEVLDEVRDSVSDFTSLGGIDFYFDARSDLILYSDKSAFEASLVTSFDQHGKIPHRKDQTDILWMHELGHALLNAKLEEDWPWFKGRLDIFRQWGLIIRESFNPGVDQSANSKLAMEQLALLNKYPHIENWDWIVSPYHELFADAVAVVYTRDPKALKNALAHPTDPDLQANDERDFSLSHESESWHHDEAHNMLSPVRSHLWSLLSQLEENERSNQEILRALYSAIKEEILTRTSDPKLWELPIPEVNRRLIKRIPRL